MFSCRDVTEYRGWLEAFSVERRVVADDRLSGFDVKSLTQHCSRLQQPVTGKQLIYLL